jgi:demethylmenaquinone methyltransferase/2-methoxy-6-polyprenyl-1,4-benzoquinol methylase/phosphoethanolamine N-methyltransferase
MGVKIGQDELPETRGHVMRWAVPFYDTINQLILLDRKYRRLLDRFAELGPDLDLLDVGCGTGNLLLFAQAQAGGRVRARGIDPSPWMLARARKKSERRGLAVEFTLGAIERIPFPDASMDRVFSTLMFHHLPGDLQEKGLSEIRRVLRPGGFLLLMDFAAVRNPLFFVLFAVHFANRSLRRQMIRGLLPRVRDAGFAEVELLEKWMFAAEVIKATR